jgi:hypothetical protein
MIDATTYAARWAAGVEAAGEKVTQGVQQTSKDPIQAAIAAAGYWQRQVSSSAALTAYKSGLGKSSKAAWQSAMVNKGIPNMAVGARDAQAKMATIGGPLLQAISAAQQAVQSMPKGKGAANEARMLAFTRRMAQYRKQ